VKLTSVRLRFTLWNIGLLALVLFGFLTVADLAIRKYLLAALDHRLQGMAERQEYFFQHPRPDGLALRPRDPLRSSFRRLSRLYDMQGNSLSPFAEGTEKPLDPGGYAQALHGQAGITITAGTEPLRVLSRPLYRGTEQVGILQVGVSYLETQTLLESLTLLFLILVPCALLVAGVGGLLLTSTMLRPVRAIIHAADALNPEDLSQRLPVVGNDEFAHLATTMNRMLARLEEAFQKLTRAIAHERRFNADASHELRTPLTAIKANTSLALRGERTPAQYREALQAIDQGAETMHRLVQDMLLLARSDSGQLAVEGQALDTAALLRDAVALLPRDGAPVEIAVAPEAAEMHGDPHHLQRLLVNLLDNARRHTPPTGRITVSAARAAGVTLTVADTGEGIAPEHLSHLGERFYRVDDARARQHGGTGLGLAICHSIVDAHRGTMTFASTPGEGTTVTVLLPDA
jgi:heavy metal sensor kinase